MNNVTESIPSNGVAQLGFTPAYSPNAAFLSFFVIIFAAQCLFAILFWRHYGYSIGMLSGLLLEILGYAAKLMLSRNPHHKDGYIMYIIGLTLGPTFLSSSLYLSISALQRNNSKARFGNIGPRLYAGLFILGDFICLCFIGVGGSLAAIFAWSPVGVNLMITGLAIQVLFTSIFCILLWAIYKRICSTVVRNPASYFMILAAVAATCLLIRSCWRCAELSGGFNGPLASKEHVFIALESIPILIMCVLMSAMHPKFWFEDKIRFQLLEMKGRVSARSSSPRC